MNHDAVFTVDLPVALVRVFKCECGFVLGTITHRMVTVASLPELDALEEALWRMHERHQKEATTLEGAATQKELTQ